jgi:hypothetical protein
MRNSKVKKFRLLEIIEHLTGSHAKLMRKLRSRAKAADLPSKTGTYMDLRVWTAEGERCGAIAGSTSPIKALPTEPGSKFLDRFAPS